jgi:LacI family transcriptional regulator
LSNAGFEDSPFSKQSWPALTTARQATEDMARHAAQRLIGNLQREANGEPALTGNDGFTPVLVVRGSTAPRHAGLARR